MQVNRQNKEGLIEKRVVGVDIAKILAILFVLTGHFYGSLSDIPPSCYLLQLFDDLVRSVIYSSIDIFIIATGFLCVNATYKYSRLLKLWIATVFWGVTVLLSIDIFTGNVVPLRVYLEACFPVFTGQYWFFSAYFFLFLFIPFLNTGIKSLKPTEAKLMAIAVGIFVCCYTFTGRSDISFFGLNKGFSAAWFAILYIIGAYIRLHSIKVSARKCLAIILLLVFTAALRHILMVVLHSHIPGDSLRFHSYLSPFTLGIAICIFVGCISLEVHSAKIRTVLKVVSSTTFGIYLIHHQPYFWHTFCNKYLTARTVDSVSRFVVILSIPLLLFFALSLVEYLRIRMFRALRVDKLIELICKV